MSRICKDDTLSIEGGRHRRNRNDIVKAISAISAGKVVIRKPIVGNAVLRSQSADFASLQTQCSLQEPAQLQCQAFGSSGNIRHNRNVRSKELASFVICISSTTASIALFAARNSSNRTVQAFDISQLLRIIGRHCGSCIAMYRPSACIAYTADMKPRKP